MDLLPYGDADIELTEALETDPAVMAELGGPVAAGEIPAIHRRRLATTEGGGWWFVIVPEPGGPRVGTIGIWESETGGERIHEAGWMVLRFHHEDSRTVACGEHPSWKDLIEANPSIFGPGKKAS